jgi:N-ethylmaleimide reductase
MTIDLFSPFEKLGLKNRIVMPPMSRYSTTEGGLPSPQLVRYYLKRAESGVGLIIIESAAIDDGASSSYVRGLKFFSNAHANSWKPVVEKIKLTGAKIWLQIYHAGRLTTPEVSGQYPIAPSALAPFLQNSHLMKEKNGQFLHSQSETPFPIPKEMNEEDIDKVKQSFTDTCSLAIKTGFDGVELHGAHGYLLHQFSNKQSNQRQDQYGPDGDQYKFISEIVEECRRNIPDDKVLSYRLSQHMVDSTFIRYSKNKMDFHEIVNRIDKSVDTYHCSELKAGTPLFGHSRSLCEEIRQVTSKVIIACGGIPDRLYAETLLNSGSVDLVAFGRNLIANPDLVKLLRTNRMDRSVTYEHDKHDQCIE